MEKMVRLKELQNKSFWAIFFAASYPNGYDEETDLAVSELAGELVTPDMTSWWDAFTGYYEGVMEECDGYLEHPTTLKAPLGGGEALTIEFHPGDIIYFINDREMGCTGPHHKLQTLPYEKVRRLLSQENGEALFLLLLPLCRLRKEERASATEQLRDLLPGYFPPDLCGSIVRCIVCGLLEEEAP